MWWDILGVEENVDKKTLKRAYLKLIRGIDQDVDIVRFTEIRDAYEFALNKHRSHDDNGTDTLNVNVDNDTSISKVNVDNERQIPRHIQALLEIYHDIETRFSVNAWSNAFGLFSLEEDMIFKEQYVLFFNKYYVLTRSVWDYIDSVYSLRDRSDFIWLDMVIGRLHIKSDDYRKVPKDLREYHLVNMIEGYKRYHLSQYKQSAIHFNQIKANRVVNEYIMKIGLITGYETCDEELFNFFYECLVNKDDVFANYYKVKFKKKLNKRKSIQLKLPIIDYSIINTTIINPWDELNSLDTIDKKYLVKGKYNNYYIKNSLNLLLGSFSIFFRRNPYLIPDILLILLFVVCIIFLSEKISWVLAFIFMGIAFFAFMRFRYDKRI